MHRYILLLFLVLAHLGKAQHRVEVKDLTHEFKIMTDGQFIDADSVKEKSKTVYLSVDVQEYKGASIELRNRGPVSLFINGKLAKELTADENIFDLDSLAALYTSPLTLALHSKKSLLGCSAKIVASLPAAGNDFDLRLRDQNHFADFSIIACGLILICFVLLFRSNPQLLFDYLNFIKLFSVQEREESILSIRIVASGNLLFYGVGSMLLSFLLLVMNFYSYGSWIWLQNGADQSTIRLLFGWITLSVILFGVLILKSLIVFSFSRLFDFSEAPNIQFFNFVRLVFMIGLIIGVWLMLYFIFGVSMQQSYVRLFYIMSIAFIFWIPIVFLKLLKRSSYSVFHLFSYLCATEIFPVVIVVKLLFL